MREDPGSVADTMNPDPHDTARRLGRILGLARRGGLLPARGRGGAGAALRNRTLARLLDRLARRLGDSATPEHRDVAAALSAAIAAQDHETALALVTTAGCRTDLRAEKMVSRRYRFLWLCNPKVASRSIIAALRAADPDAELFRDRTLDEVLARRPEARGYFTFAFIRHPLGRTRSCHADKHALALRDRRAARWFIEPWHGLTPGMTFAGFCRWLDTPWGSDAFADRHWLSQHRQIRAAGGRLPDFLGNWERLDADWRAVTARLGLPFRELPRLNAGPRGVDAAEPPGTAIAALLRRRYAEDFRIGGYDEASGHGLRGRLPEPPARAPARSRAADGRG